MALDLFQVVLSLIACAFYVVETYIDMENVGWWKVVEMAFTLNFLVDYIFRFYVAKDKMVYYFSPMALVDFITVVPPLVWAVLVMSLHSFNAQQASRISLLCVRAGLVRVAPKCTDAPHKY